MTLDAWLERIEQLHPAGIELGLARVAAVHARLPQPTPNTRVITVAGTNGKGTTVNAVASALTVQGYQTGSYTSPHLNVFNERICINRQLVCDDVLIAAFEAVDEARQGTELTYFEFTTLAAFVVFAAQKLDIWVLEVGLGGRLDAVNILDADIAIITRIGLDHQDWLGTTLDEIASEKAGIMRRGGHAICSDQQPPKSIASTAANLAVALHQLGDAFSFEERLEGDGVTCVWDYHGIKARREGLPRPPGLALENLAGACAALELLDALPSSEVLSDLFAHWQFPGRQQQCELAGVNWLLDVAHNEDSAQLLATRLMQRPKDVEVTLVIGMLADKPVAHVVQLLAPHVSRWICTDVEAARALSVEQLANLVKPVTQHAVEQCASVAAACALAQARTQSPDWVVVTGSFHTVGPALVWLGPNTATVDSVES